MEGNQSSTQIGDNDSIGGYEGSARISSPLSRSSSAKDQDMLLRTSLTTSSSNIRSIAVTASIKTLMNETIKEENDEVSSFAAVDAVTASPLTTRNYFSSSTTASITTTTTTTTTTSTNDRRLP
jgi:hypothetical protein